MKQSKTIDGDNLAGAVLIGRNEGERLIRALAAARKQTTSIVYVDSGSNDGSVEAARASGAIVVPLDMSRPFSAARARNAGFKALREETPVKFIQFIDGDCTLVDGWMETAVQHLQENPHLAVATGWRSEINRNASVYNQMCDFEWHRPAGLIIACGGDMMVRSEAFQQIGGFDPDVIAAEDDEFCLRLAKAGWQLERLPLNMTRHDVAMTKFSQWWRRAVRAGHGYAQVGYLHPGYFAAAKRRSLLFGLVLPVVAIIGAAINLWITIIAISVYAISYARTSKGLLSDGLPLRESLHHSMFLVLSKFPNLAGMLTFFARKFRSQKPNIIEYK